MSPDLSNKLLTDAELCAMLRISRRTLRDHMRNGPPRKRYPNSGDLRLVRHVMIGGQRRWPRAEIFWFTKSQKEGEAK